jgi:hypothetical protein
MTAPFRLLLVILVALPMSAQIRTSGQAPPIPAGALTLHITARHDVVKVGSEVEADIVFANVGKETLELDFSGSGGLLDYFVDVLDEHDSSPPLTFWGKSTPGTLNPYTKILPPGKSFEDNINISRLYDLSQPGKYRIQLERGYPRGGKRSGIKSNLIVVTVTP